MSKMIPFFWAAKIAGLTLPSISSPRPPPIKLLLKRTGATGVLGLSADYLGYVETPERVAQREGESKRQYYGARLLERLGEAAQLASETAGFTVEP